MARRLGAVQVAGSQRLGLGGVLGPDRLPRPASSDTLPPGVLTTALRSALRVLRKIVALATLINIDERAVIGPGTFIPHFGPIQINGEASIGADCAIHQVCTIGAGSRPGAPVIEDHVFIGAHTCVLGPVRIGAGAVIGSGAVVIGDIPAGAIAVGVPAHPIAR